MAQYLRADLARDIPLRKLASDLQPFFPAIAVAPKCQIRAGVPDPPGMHLHPFTLKVQVAGLIIESNFTVAHKGTIPSLGPVLSESARVARFYATHAGRTTCQGTKSG